MVLQCLDCNTRIEVAPDDKDVEVQETDAAVQFRMRVVTPLCPTCGKFAWMICREERESNG